VGVLCAMAAQAQGAARVLVADMVADRLAFAQEVLCVETIVVGPGAAPAADRVRALLPEGADLVIESVGLPGPLVDAAMSARTGGRVSVVGVHAEESLELPIGDLFRRGVDLLLCGPSNVQGVWREVMAAIVDGRLRPSAVVSHHLGLDEAAEGYALFADRKAMKIVLDVAGPAAP